MHKWITLGIVAAVASLAVSLAIERHTRIRSRELADSSRQQADQSVQLSDENQRLSNIVARISSSQSLSPGQLRELLALRNEVGQLRGTTAEKEQLEATNARLHAVVAESEKQLAEAQAAPNYWARDQLTFAGYSDPTSAMRSILWAMNNLSSSGVDWWTLCTPEARTKMEKEWDKHGMSAAQRTAELHEMAGQMMSAAAGFRVLDQKIVSPNETIVSLSFDGEGATRKFVLRKIGNEWKFHDLILAGQQDAGY